MGFKSPRLRPGIPGNSRKLPGIPPQTEKIPPRHVKVRSLNRRSRRVLGDISETPKPRQNPRNHFLRGTSDRSRLG